MIYSLCLPYHQALKALTVTFTKQPLTNGDIGLLAQLATPEEIETTQSRAAQTLYHTNTRIAMFSLEGQLIFENPASRLSRHKGAMSLAKRFYNYSDYESFYKQLITDGVAEGVYRVVAPKGYRWHDISLKLDFDPDTGKQAIMYSATDVTKRIEAELVIRYNATHDSLTGLANRSRLESILQRHLSNSQSKVDNGSIFFIDLDHFKTINDTLGHQAGDDLLVTIAKRLQNSVQENGLVARVGGDEFVVFFEKITCREKLTQLAKSIRYALSQPIQLQQRTIQVSPSIGIALFPEHAVDYEELLSKADLAMYKSKEQGRNQYRFYEPEMSQAIEKRVAVETSLRNALSLKELVLHYQPRLEIGSNKIIGAEAQLYWQHPRNGLISAKPLLNAAEQTGLIDEVGEWVAETAMHQQSKWERAGHSLHVTFGISKAQLRRGGLSKRFTRLQRKIGINPANVLIEFKQDILMEKKSDLIKEILALKYQGFQLGINEHDQSIADLEQLHNYPISTINVGHSLIQDPVRWPIIQLIRQLSTQLELQLVASGVETKEQLNNASRMGCAQYQGTYFSSPLCPLEFDTLLMDAHIPLCSNA
ncbi:putative bifunctional diguanylate cyclase/phosphodiesterase [Polycladidibacter stylochi]|uniref:putative bifunctional diguanylate cyclase/phosphodiesterase n=1 Tax=Polycladidibacter stylochi TaxID=1807766 RepID=UPI00138EE4B1|nr:diguanylate cyclase [Pseudovibrio stylochi]